MSSGKLAQVAEEIFVRALERDAAERSQFVAARCGGDGALERTVVSMLLMHEQKGPFDRLVEEVAGLRERLFAQSGTKGDEPAPPRLDPGSKLERYEIREQLGVGGMGEVFRAFDARLQRQVAIKVISRQVEDRPDAVARFEREARAASASNHPNIVTVYDIDRQQGFPYLVMELIEGESLHQLLRSPLPIERLIPLATQIAAGLAAAHSAGVVHRDLKPSNVMIDAYDTVRILDFGVASLGLDESEETLALNEAPVDARGLVGTLGYMAPEAIRGQPVDHRADQFAFGVILYEMTTGRSPFPRSTAAEVLLATLNEQPLPLEDADLRLPRSLVELIDRCLQKDPADRFDSTSDLHRQLAELRPALRTQGSLPTAISRLFGRDEDLEQIRELASAESIRLLTFTGVGGAGKTRLAIEAAHQVSESFVGGVIFAPLASTDDPDLLIPALARAIGDDRAMADDLTEIAAFVNSSTESSLLVIDNFEQIIDAAAAIGELVASCPRLTVWVTSREPLRVSGEHVFQVRPLTLPPPDSASLDQLSQVASVAMFVDRARAADPDFELRPSNSRAVAAICRRFDGLPLALELIAPRVRLMSPAEMLDRLTSRMESFSDGPRDLPHRQQTLRAAMDWSYDLLDEAEKTVLRRLAVFVDGFTLDAAQAVVDPFARLQPGVQRGVEALLDHSLLMREVTDTGEVRFSMLELVAEYARERMLEDEKVATLRRAHAAYFLVLAEEINVVLCREPSPEWLDRARREQGNFRAAFDWAIAEDEGEWGMRMAKGLFQVWDIGEGLVEGGRYMAQLLELPSTQGESELRADVLFRAGSIAHKRRDFPTNITCQQKALAIYRRLGNLRGQAVALNALGIAYTDKGDYGDARHCYEECRQIWESLDESSSVAATLSNFAYVARLQGELEEARELYREAAAMCRRLDDPAGAAWKLSHEADVARDQGDPQANGLYERSLAIFRELDDPWGIASTLVELAEIAELEGSLEAATASHREALSIFQELGHSRGVARVLEGLALLEARRSHDERALMLAAAAAGLRERSGETSDRSPWSKALQSEVTRARSRLGDKTAKRIWEQGRNRPIEPLVEGLLDSDQA